MKYNFFLNDKKFILDLYKVNKAKPIKKGLISYLKINDDCNLKCDYCFQKSDNKIKKIIKLREYIQIISKIKQSSDKIYLFGGEPLLLKNYENIRYLLESKINLRIFTNGTFEKCILDLLLENHRYIDKLIFALDGTEETHNSRKNVAINSFQKSIYNIKSINGRIKFEIQINIDKTNIDTIFDLISYIINTIPLKDKGYNIVLNRLMKVKGEISELELVNLYIKIKDKFNNKNILVNSVVVNKLATYFEHNKIDIDRCNIRNIKVYDFSKEIIYRCPQNEYKTITNRFHRQKVYEDNKNNLMSNLRNGKLCLKCIFQPFCNKGCLWEDKIKYPECKENLNIIITKILDKADYFFYLEK
ncbi:MAG: radical SAM protein [Tissierellia bacterium]|nr:radical SAM protein [Tissierellia bacterium]